MTGGEVIVSTRANPAEMKREQKEYAAQLQLKEHRRRLILILIPTAAGIVLSAWLIWIHLSETNGAGFGKLLQSRRGACALC